MLGDLYHIDALYGDSIPYFEKYIKQFQAWYVCDSFCHHPMAKIINENSDFILPILHRWVTSKDKWLRRSVGVYLHAFFAENPKQRITNKLEILDILMQDNDLDVKKGVGWALRAMTKNYKNELFEFINKWLSVDNKDTYSAHQN